MLTPTIPGEPTSSQAHTSILWQTLSIAIPMSLSCAAKLCIPDIIHNHGGSVSLPVLARAASIPPAKEPALHRLMRLLVVTGVFAFENNVYLLTPLSKLLTKDGDNMSPYVTTLLGQLMTTPWHFMADWFVIEDAAPAFDLANRGGSFWEVTMDRPEMAKLFNEAMAANSRWVVKAVLEKFPELFRGVRSLVDVGGGNGTVAAMIADTFPGVKCVVFDLPHVVAELPETGGVDVVGGDMFEYVPPADAVLLKNILHDWDDEDCIRILKRCKEAIPSKEEGGRIIIIDIIINLLANDQETKETQLFFDLAMLIGATGKEREEHEWRQIINDAGFKDYKIFPMFSLFSVIELHA